MHSEAREVTSGGIQGRLYWSLDTFGICKDRSAEHLDKKN